MDLDKILRHPSVRQSVPPRQISEILHRVQQLEDRVNSLEFHEDRLHSQILEVQSVLSTLDDVPLFHVKPERGPRYGATAEDLG